MVVICLRYFIQSWFKLCLDISNQLAVLQENDCKNLLKVNQSTNLLGIVMTILISLLEDRHILYLRHFGIEKYASCLSLLQKKYLLTDTVVPGT